MILFLILFMLALDFLRFSADTNFVIALVLLIVGAVHVLTGWPSGPLIVVNKRN